MRSVIPTFPWQGKSRWDFLFCGSWSKGESAVASHSVSLDSLVYGEMIEAIQSIECVVVFCTYCVDLSFSDLVTTARSVEVDNSLFFSGREK